MKILTVTNDLGYFRAHRENIALAMAQEGHEIIVAAGGSGGIDVSNWPSSMHLFPLGLYRHRFKPFEDLKLIANLRKLIQQEQPDLIHTITIKPILYSALAMTLMGGKTPPVIWTFPGLGKIFEPHQTVYGKLRHLAVSTALKFAKKRLSVTTTFENEDDRQRMIDLGLTEPNQAHALMGTGLSKDVYSYSPKSARDKGKLIVLLATRLLNEKGVDTYLEAASRLHGDKLVFQLAGPLDTSNPDCVSRHTIQHAEDQGHITYLGALDAKGVVEAMTDADIFCLPTRLREGFPRSLMEAAALKCCLVASDQNTVRRLVRDGETGTLLSPPDADRLCAVLADIASDPDKARTMGESAYTLAHSLPIWNDDVVQTLREVYLTATTQSLSGNRQVE